MSVLLMLRMEEMMSGASIMNRDEGLFNGKEYVAALPEVTFRL